ncbi:hypothetical protein AO240_11780 [Pseudomonas sp. ICMP 460]|nr:hypothetical protein AO240_11780 [Pseudomonas sp. ICMP 460]
MKGRFYWMGLAAFASKQVRCGLDFIPNEPYLIMSPPIVQPPLRIGKKNLGKGNFWLFQDIFVWHWFYSKYPDQFDECAPERDVSSFEGQIKANVESLPWAEDALPVLKNLHVTDDILKGFDYIEQVEKLPSGIERRSKQLLSLNEIANHEQRKILQPLIYENFLFRATLDMQAFFERVPLLPVRLAAFSTACEVDDPELSVQMKEGDLYNETDRMEFIGAIVDQFHALMRERKTYMESEIFEISTWASVK